MSRQHATLSASGAHRWIACTPSALLEAKFPDSYNESAEEGTFAHAWAEVQLKKFFKLGNQDKLNQLEKEMKEDKWYSAGLAEYVDEYVSMVTSLADDNSVIKIEDQLDFGKWVPGGFGTGDAVFISDNKLTVCDLKYGKNVPVSAIDNPQLRLYALGAYEAYNFLYDIEEVRVMICQPRNGGISEETLTVEELLAWGEQVKEIAEKAIKGAGETVAGEHCRFCKAATQCKALRDYNLAGIDPAKGCDDLMSPEELAVVFSRADGIISYLNSVKAFCLDRALQGRPLPGYKLVEGRSNRKYTDEQKIADELLEAGYKDFYKPQQLIGITDMQKLLGKKKFEAMLSEYLIKPPGKPVLVPVTDARPEYNNAADDFEVLKGEN